MCGKNRIRRSCLRRPITEVAKAGLLPWPAAEGPLKITELQLQGKKRMDAAAFLRGYHLEAGMKLG